MENIGGLGSMKGYWSRIDVRGTQDRKGNTAVVDPTPRASHSDTFSWIVLEDFQVLGILSASILNTMAGSGPDQDTKQSRGLWCKIQLLTQNLTIATICLTRISSYLASMCLEYKHAKRKA